MALEAWYDVDSEAPTIVETAADLDRVLDIVAEWDGRFLVALNLANPSNTDMRSRSLDVGIYGKRNQGALLHVSPAQVWFSKATTGPEWSAADRILYYYMNCDTEYPADSEIPLDVVRRAAHEFMATNGERPTSPVWHSPPEWYPTAF